VRRAKRRDVIVGFVASTRRDYDEKKSEVGFSQRGLLLEIGRTTSRVTARASGIGHKTRQIQNDGDKIPKERREEGEDDGRWTAQRGLLTN
jgi:hypothetical protein